ncbi:T9SS C-terminal target domain-containing protein [Bacteroidetes/Chlorobi group bacterium Naka2016]|nr:MAG: T9SS C-terminal target domain-containing protein [Bacteroidetes/Chlorobi group bacterium Naka2016]
MPLWFFCTRFITPNKQLLYSGYLVKNYYYSFPYLLKTNFAFLNSLLKDTPIKVCPVVNDSFPLIEYPENQPFPNPISGEFTLQLDTNEHSGKIELFDIVGNLVRTLFIGEHNSQRFDFDISDVSPCLYSVKVTQPHTTKILKIMKNNN